MGYPRREKHHASDVLNERSARKATVTLTVKHTSNLELSDSKNTSETTNERKPLT